MPPPEPNTGESLGAWGTVPRPGEPAAGVQLWDPPGPGGGLSGGRQGGCVVPRGLCCPPKHAVT